MDLSIIDEPNLQDLTKLQLRDYQLECVSELLKRNLIINLPTGKGKTLIAAAAIEYFLRQQPPSPQGKKAMFIVHTRVLVKQQSQYLQTYCQHHNNNNSNLRVLSLSGGDTEQWNEQQWAIALQTSDVIVGVDEIFRRALVNSRVLRLEDFCIVVFDECHHCVSGSPMASICRDALFRLKRNDATQLRVVGLTASFVNGSVTGGILRKKRNVISQLMQANLYSPPSFRCGDGVRYQRVWYPPTNHHLLAGENTAVVEDMVNELMESFATRTKGIRQVDRIARSARHVFHQLGSKGFVFYLSECIVSQLEQHVENLERFGSETVHTIEERCQMNRNIETLKQTIPMLKRQLRCQLTSLKNDPRLTSLPPICPKCQTLLELLHQLFSSHQTDPNFKGIVFVNRISLTHPLKHIIESYFQSSSSPIYVGAISGGGSMNDTQRETAIQHFQSNKTKIIVCTPATEEGFDVPNCKFVIRFEAFDTARAHIQGSGRARDENAVIYYFENDPTVEESRRTLIDDCARKKSLDLDGEVLEQTKRVALSKEMEDVHPWRRSVFAGQLDIFNSVSVVHEYFSKTMRRGVGKGALLDYRNMQAAAAPVPMAKVLYAIKVPSPKGWMRVDHQDVELHFRGGDENKPLTHVPLLDTRAAKFKTTELLERKFYFVAAVTLSKKGYLDMHNNPTSEALENTMRECFDDEIVGKKSITVSLRDRFPTIQTKAAPGLVRYELNTSNDLQTISFNVMTDHNDDTDNTNHQIQTKPKEQTQFNPSIFSVVLDTLQKDPVSVLNEYFQKRNNTSCDIQEIQPQSSQLGKFKMMILLPDGTAIKGAEENSKKMAKKSCAKRAVDYLVEQKVLIERRKCVPGSEKEVYW